MKHFATSTPVSAIQPKNGRSTIAFSEMFHRIVAKSSILPGDIRVATLGETLEALALAREALPVASDDVVRAVYAHNSECFRVVRREPFSSSYMMAYLPLNAAGVAALVDGSFDPGAPQMKHVCLPGELPTSIYLWLSYVPRNMIAGLRMIRELELIGGGAAVFTRPAHAESHRILEAAGFIAARGIFPSAPETLLVVLALGEAEGANMRQQVMTVRVARDFQDIAKIISIRTATYMTECPPSAPMAQIRG